MDERRSQFRFRAPIRIDVYRVYLQELRYGVGITQASQLAILRRPTHQAYLYTYNPYRLRTDMVPHHCS